MRRLTVALIAAALLAAMLTFTGGAASAQSGGASPGSQPPRPAPAGAHWEYRTAGPDAVAPEAGAPEVVGGTPATPGTFDYQVALVSPSVPGLNIRGQFCGGSLIAPDAVLTAAHCVVAGIWVLVGPGDQIIDVEVDLLRPSDVDVLAGDVNLGRDSAAERLDVRQIRLHPGFTVDLDSWFDPFVPDVAVLQLATPSTTGTPVALATPAQAALYTAGTTATVSGWGNTGNPLAAAPTVLQHADLPISSDADCTIAYGTDVDIARQLCAGDLVDGLPTPCFGDSGGPLVVDDAGSPLQVGVVLAGDGCPAPERPAVFARVAAEAGFVGRYLDPDEVPDRPRNVAITQRGSRVRVSWRPPEFDGGAKITGYSVTITGANVGLSMLGGGGGARHFDTTVPPLRPGVRYTVKVKATNAMGTGAARVRTFTVRPVALP
ncbi:MAG: trypsin-like serine protease [Acidimicrobiales bacterium]|nr:trypsin-like serine protease [Acidimicrobiales bacterium]